MTERTRLWLFAAVAACGLLIVALSFLPWLRFESSRFEESTVLPELVLPGNVDGVSIDLAGTETSRLRDIEVVNTDTVQEEDGWCTCRVDIGDGYLTAALGVLIIAGAALAILGRRERPGAATGVVGGLLALGVGGFNAIADWQALAWTRGGHLEAVDGTVQPALIALVVIAAVAAVVSVAAWSLAAPEPLEEEAWWDEPENGDYLASEGTETWA